MKNGADFKSNFGAIRNRMFFRMAGQLEGNTLGGIARNRSPRVGETNVSSVRKDF